MSRCPVALVLVLLASLVCGASADADAPQRVVSMNLCTDQLSMMLAAPGQLISVSYLAVDERASAMAEEAENYEINHGLAEEIYLMRPDLVVAGSFSTRTTVDMLRRLDVPIVVLDPAYGLAEIPERIEQLGKSLGREEAARALITSFEDDLDQYRADLGSRPRAALYYANGYTSGDKTLAGEILAVAGFTNIAAEAGFADGGIMPLEVLAMSQPDILISGAPYPGASRAEDILDHPVVRALRDHERSAVLSDRDWICGTPYVLRAIQTMRGHRDELRTP